MKRYTLKIITSLFALLFIFSSCDEDILNRIPLDQMNDQSFWTTKDNLELYANQFYANLPQWEGYDIGMYKDYNTDNIYFAGNFNILQGIRTVPAGGGGWSYSNIRNVNYFLDNYENAGLDISQVNQSVGVVYFFRAYFYFNMVKRFGDVQWFENVQNVDSEELYKPRDPRNVVIDNIIADLDKAAELLASGKISGGNVLSKEIALLFKSRVCLYEGTWEKHHAGTPFAGNGNVNGYLTLAADAAFKVMESGVYSINNTGDLSSDGDYARLFNQNNYSSNKEIMLWKKYDFDVGLRNFSQRFNNMWPRQRAVTASLVDSYLCTDGEPIGTSSLFKGYDLDSVHVNRDARLGQTVYFPGDLWQYKDYNENTSNWTKYYQFPDHTGKRFWQCPGMYRLQKVNNPDLDQLLDMVFWCETGFTIFRYAEALLNYAEAKAELGDLTQDDIDKTINLLRDRAGVAPLNMGNIATDPNWDYPSLTPILNEVRRERRVEFACEGYRFDDLMRWRAHHLFVGKRPLGGKFFDYYGGGSPVSVNADGEVDYKMNALPNGYEFVPGRDYLFPIPLDQITLTGGAVVQNPGWE